MSPTISTKDVSIQAPSGQLISSKKWLLQVALLFGLLGLSRWGHLVPARPLATRPPLPRWQPASPRAPRAPLPEAGPGRPLGSITLVGGRL